MNPLLKGFKGTVAPDEAGFEFNLALLLNSIPENSRAEQEKYWRFQFQHLGDVVTNIISALASLALAKQTENQSDQ